MSPPPGKMSDELLQASVQVIDRARCNAEDAYQGEVTAEMLCAGVLQGGVDTCQVSLGGAEGIPWVGTWVLERHRSPGAECPRKSRTWKASTCVDGRKGEKQGER